MAVSLQTYNEILGKLVRKIIADTPVNDINTGSVLLTLLEAVAAQDFENNSSILSVLETLNIDALKNSDLDTRAADYGLSRRAAIRSTGFVTIKDTSIVKRSTTLYGVKPAPIAGATIIYVNDASDWDPAGGTLYIGRGTQQFEGPVTYTSIVNNGSFYTISLGSALQKDHLVSDTVIDGQGTLDRLIPAGTIVKIPANNLTPEVRFVTLRNAVLPAGEDSAAEISIVAENAGVSGNAGINTIVQFASLPFGSAAVTNTSPLTDGRDVESDDELRERIKNYASTLARGTRAAILAAIIGVSDSTDGKQVSSAVITEPADVGTPSIVYIDDGSGFQPSFAGQSVDILLSSAVGDEEFLQLANFPLPRPQVINQVSGPLELTAGMKLRVSVDGAEEEVTFSAGEFTNIAAATLAEIVVSINDQATENGYAFRARLAENSSRILIYPTAHDAEYIQVSPIKNGEDPSAYANSVLKFPTNKYSYITLYRNNELLTEKEFPALLETATTPWLSLPTSGNVILQVDGTPPQNASFAPADFNGKPLTAVSLTEWASVFNLKFAGITATPTSSGKIQIRSNKSGSGSSLALLGGNLLGTVFSGSSTYSTGTQSQFTLNRQTGNLQLKITLSPGDTITAGTVDAKGSVTSAETSNGTFNLSTDSASRPAELVIAADGSLVTPRSAVILAIGSAVTISTPSSGVMRLMSNAVSSFERAQVGDYIYIVYRGASSGWVASNNAGLFKILAKGSHLTASTDTYLDVANIGATAQGPLTVISDSDVQIFGCNVYPQIWRGSYLPTPASASLKDIASSIQTRLLNVGASIFKTNSVRLTSTTENGGSIATPVSVGSMTLAFPTGQGLELGNQSHVASRVTGKDLFSMFKRTAPTSTNVWLDRFRYADVKDALDVDAVPNPSGYSETITASGTFNSSTMSYDDVVNVTSGSNKSQFRYVKEFLVGDEVGTQIATPRTEFGYHAGDEVGVARGLSLSSDDSIVFIMDGDAVNKTINVNMWRTGRVNNQYSPSATAFSADDADNESGINFGTLQVWSTTTAGTDFSDYALWMRSRNWYRTGGALASTATMIVRAKEYGPTGDKHRLRLEYPSTPDQSASVRHDNQPDYTLTTYSFASGTARSTGIVGGTTFKVTQVSPNNWRYKFQQSYVDLSSVVVGDIISLSAASGVSAANRGTFRINAKDSVNRTIDIYNPNGAATSVGLPEITNVTAVADVPGMAMQQTITTTQQGSTAGQVDNSRYFVLYDDVGPVVFWYDISGSAAQPTGPAGSRYIRIPTILVGDSAANVATKTAAMIESDLKFSAIAASNTITVTNSFVGPVTVASNGPNLSFVFATSVPGVAQATLGGKYFKIYDKSGSVAVWYNTGSSALPPHGCDRAIQVAIASGASASAVATATASFVGADSEFSASVLGSVATITDAENGSRIDAANGTAPYSTGFTIAVSQQGVDDGVEGINATTSCSVFPLVNNDVASICNTISTSQTLIAVPVGDPALAISKATREEVYAYSGNPSALAYGHNPDPTTGLNSYVSLHDGESFVQTFSNSSPQFTLKKPLVLPGVVPSIYTMNSCPNQESADLGEFFKLIPKTIKNIKHHLTQKALSQLPIVAEVDVVDRFRRIQIKSKKLGTAGSVEIVGGRANIGEFSIFGDAIVTPGEGSVNYLELKVSAFPSTINSNDLVEIYNDLPAKRRSRLTSDSTISISMSGSNAYYRFNPRTTRIGPFTGWTIADVSASYGKVAGLVWRWTHTESGAKVIITSKVNGVITTVPTDYIADGSTESAKLQVYEYAQGVDDVVGPPAVPGKKMQFSMAISAVPTQADYFYFEADDGSTYAVWYAVDGNATTPSTVSGPYNSATYKVKVDILSTDSLNTIVSKTYIALTDPLSPAAVAFLTDFDAASIPGTNLSNVLAGDVLNAYGTFSAPWTSANQSYAAGDLKASGFPVVFVNAASRYVDVLNPTGATMASASFSGLNATISVSPTPFIRFRLKHSALSTKYKIESLGMLDLFRITRASGPSPYFADCGAAVDDFVVIGGSSFSSANAGRFRILAVDNDSLIIQNAGGVEELNTYRWLSYGSYPSNTAVTWTSGSSTVIGAAGSFANVSSGDWVKKTEDDDDYFVQVQSVGSTSITLGQNYRGVTASATGVVTNFETDVGQGTLLLSDDDLAIYEGDSVIVGDSLVVDAFTSFNWFNQVNTGTRPVVSWGSSSGIDTPYLSPYIRVTNASGISQSNRTVGLKLDGFYVLEGEDYKYKSIRQVYNTSINQTSSTQRILYLNPSDRAYKMSQAYETKVKSLGKLEFPLGITTGVDGYSYYTGLMRTVQRIIDGYEPESSTYPGQRAVGSSIEVLPPLIQQIQIALKITTKEGVNLTDITNDIKSAVINYISSLGVGGDVVLSEIIARVKAIIGIDAVTFTTPAPSEERIPVADDEKAFITPELISLS
jgi:uncharacterized phage protein gp47/JayE